MGKRDSLVVNMSKLQNNLQLDFGKSMYYDQIVENDQLLMYKYVSLLQINDFTVMTDNLKQKLEYMQSSNEQGSEEQRKLEDQIRSYESYIEFARRLYACEGECERIACLPIDGRFEQTMLNHKRELEGIYDVNEDSVRAYSDLINTSFFNLQENNEEVQVNYGDAIRLNEEAFGREIVLPALDETEAVQAAECCERLNQITQLKSENERSEEEQQLIDDIEEMIESGDYIGANNLLDKYEQAIVSNCSGGVDISSEEASNEEVEMESDKKINADEQAHLQEVLDEHLYDQDNEFSYGPSL